MSIQALELDGLVLLQLHQHAAQASGRGAATGQVFGVDSTGALQVTHSLPFPLEADARAEARQVTVLSSLRRTGYDTLNVGFYVVAEHGEFLNDTFVRTMLMYEEQAPQNAVALVIDPLEAQIGRTCGVRAFRVSPEIAQLANERRLDVASLEKLELFTELPVQIVTGALIDVYLAEHGYAALGRGHPRAGAVKPATEGLSLAAASGEAEAHVERLTELLDGLLQQQQHHLRFYFGDSLTRRQQFFRRPLQPVDAALLARQITAHCTNTSQSSQNAFSRLFLVKNTA